MISVITPTYNRAYCLEELYKSLVDQTCTDFEWIIIDDGSTDNTELLVREWLHKEKRFIIKFEKKINGGKHRAINRAVELAAGNYIFIVDSDDVLTKDAIEKALLWIHEITENSSFAAVSGRRAKKNGSELGDFPKKVDYIDAKNTDRIRKHLTGDKAEIYKAEILKKYPFPEFENEKFLPESVVWDEIAHDGYQVRWYKDVIYLCEYQKDGLTVNVVDHIEKSFRGYSLAKQKSYHYFPFPYNWLSLVSYMDVAWKLGKKQEEIMTNMNIGKIEYAIASVLHCIWKNFQ